jgi:hypothetical protein
MIASEIRRSREIYPHEKRRRLHEKRRSFARFEEKQCTRRGDRLHEKRRSFAREEEKLFDLNADSKRLM